MNMRPYQSIAIEKTLAALERSGSAVLQMPTGAGKTKTATEIIANHDGVVWFLCHRKEIIRQAAKAFRASGIDFGVISPAKDPETEKKYVFQPEKRVQLASVGSIGRRIAELPSPSLVVWDECQHTPADSWRVLRDKTLNAKHIGLTATPERLDGAGLRDLFDDMIVGPSIDQLVEDGYLSKYRYFAPSEPDLSAARMRGGDYRREDLDKVMNTPVLIGDAVAEYKKSVPGKRALVFAASVDASKTLVERFLSEGIPAAHVDGDTPDDERDAAVAALASGDICVLSNVEVFTEGFDIPAIDAVILMRPTRSVRLLLQMIGRALRIAEGKDCAMLFDHAGLYHEHGWFADNWAWSLDGGAAKERRKALGRGPRKCPECKEVRAEREPVCACGFEFPTGREIGEYDGVLREVRGVVPEGCETVSSFARRCSTSWGSVSAWLARGMPNQSGFPSIREALAWVAENTNCRARGSKNLSRDNRDRLTTFAKRHEVSTGLVRNSWLPKGLPVDDLGFIISDAGDAWVRENVEFGTIRAMQKLLVKTPGLISQKEFSAKYGVTQSSVHRWVRVHGMPALDGEIIEKEADEWVASNIDLEATRQRSLRRAPIPGFVTRTEFASMRGITIYLVEEFIKQGMPTSDSLVPAQKATAWLDRALWLKRQYTSKVGFGRVLGHKSRTHSARVSRSLLDAGLPYDPKLGIPIREALEWVRDNRPDIVIPPDAWPTADNDNQAITKAA